MYIKEEGVKQDIKTAKDWIGLDWKMWTTAVNLVVKITDHSMRRAIS